MDQVDEIRRKTDIVELISGSGIILKKAGRNFKGLCPFHEEKTPSFMVSSERQIFKCFGCQEGGDVFGWMIKREGMDFVEALRALAQKAGVELKSYRPTKEQKIKERLLEINHLASEYYHYLLMEHKMGKKALQYLMKRGITKALMREFKLGYSADEWEGLQNFLVKKKGYKADELEMVGLVIKGKRGFYDRFRNRIVFTLFDHRKRVVGFAGRVFETESNEAKYMNTPETSLYHKSHILYGLEKTFNEIKRKNKAVVVEGELDAISSFKVGVKNVVAIKGSALTAEQIELLKRFTENIALALDEDVAGDKAARRGIEMAEKAGLSVRVINLKYGKDPDECAQKSSRLWKDSVKTAVPIYDFYIQSAKKRHGVDTPEGKRHISDEVTPVLSRISNQVIKAHYVKKLAQVLGVSEEAVGDEVEKARRKEGSGERVRKVTKEVEVKGRQERLEEYVLALILQVDSEVDELVKLVEEAMFSAGAVKKVVGGLKKWVKTKKQWKVNKFVESLPEELVAAVDAAYLTDLGKLASDPDKLRREIKKTMEELRKISLKSQMMELSEKIKGAEVDKDKKKLEKLNLQFVKLSREINN